MRRIQIALIGFALFGLILAAQLVRYQVFSANAIVGWSVGNEPPALYIDPAAPRGTIVDAAGHPLALDEYEYKVSVAPNQMKNRREDARTIGRLLGIDDIALERKLEENKKAPYLFLTTAGPVVGEQIIAMDVFTITAEPMPKRYYPEGRLASHILGFVAGDRRGYYGLEGYYDNFLRAKVMTPLLQEAPQTVAGTLPLPRSPFIPSGVRQDLALSLDRNLQFLAEKALKEAVKQTRAEGGTVIIMKPHGSEILALASVPDFDPNNHTKVADDNAYLNPATSVLYEPGSVFKLVTFAAALDAGAITPEKKYTDTDEFVYGERKIQNWDRQGRGRITAAEALAESLNVTTAKIAVELGKANFYKTVQRFGFGQITGVELANEYAGIVKQPGKGDWYPADLAINSFGQGISVTPLQMANAVAAIASDGVLYRPHIVQQIVDGNRISDIDAQPLSKAISPQTARTLTRLMVDTVERTPDVPIEGYAIAGKSGTAEIPLPSGYMDPYTIASFAGFFPADDPQFVVLVKLDRAKTNRWATYTAAPLFHRIVEDLIQLYSIPPDNVRQEAGKPAGKPASN